MDPITIIAAINAASSGIAVLVRAAERMRQAGEITETQMAAVKAAATAIDSDVDAIVAAARVRLGR